MKLIKGSIIKYGESVSIGAGLGLSEDQTGLVELITSGVGGGATTLDSLTDVVITSAATGDYLRYDGANWVDSTIQAGDIPSHTHTANQINSGTFPAGRYTFTNGPVIIGSTLGSPETLLVSGSARFCAGNGVNRTTQLGLGRFEDVGTSNLYELQTADTDLTYGGDSLFFYSVRWGSLIHFVRGSPLGDRRFASFESGFSNLGGIFRLYDGSSELGNIGVDIAAGVNPNVTVMSGTLVGKLQALGAAGGPAIYLGAQSNDILKFIVNNNPRFNITTGGHFVAETDNVYDIGAIGNRPRVLYLSSGIVIGPLITDPNPEVKSIIKGSNAGFLFKGTGVPNFVYGMMHAVNTFGGFAALAEGAGGSAEIDIEYTGPDDGSTVMYFSRARGTPAAPSFVSKDDLLGRTDYISYKGTGTYPHDKSIGASHIVRADGPWTAGSHPTRFEWWTTLSGTTTPAQRMTLNSSGTLFVGDTATSVQIVRDGTLGTYRLELFSNNPGLWPYITAEGESTGGSELSTAAFDNNPDGCGYHTFGHFRGTRASPQYLLANDSIGISLYRGYSGAGTYPNVWHNAAQYDVTAPSGWTASSRPTKFSWWVTASGSTSMAQVLTLDSTTLRTFSSITIPNSTQGSLWGRNAANTANLNLFGLDSGDNLNIGRDDGVNVIQLFGTTQILDDATTPVDVFTAFANGVVLVGKDLGGVRTLRVSGSVQVGGILYSPSTVVYPVAVRGRYYSESDNSGGAAGFAWRAHAAGANQKMWDVLADTVPALTFRLLDDVEGNSNTWLRVNRGTATNITSIVLPSGVIMVGPDPGVPAAGTPRMRIDGNVRIGNLQAGTWPGGAGYAFFGHANADHSVTGNYALLQGDPSGDGSTFLNARSGTKIGFRVGNVEYGSLDTTTGWDLSGAVLKIRGNVWTASNENGRLLYSANNFTYFGLTTAGGGFVWRNATDTFDRMFLAEEGYLRIGSDIGGSARLRVDSGIWVGSNAGDNMNINMYNIVSNKSWGFASFTDGTLYLGRNDASNRVTFTTSAFSPGSIGLMTLGVAGGGWGDLYLNTIGKFKATPTGTLRTDDVWAYNGTDWTNRFLQTNFAAGDVVAAMHSGTNYSYVNTVTTPAGSPTAPTNAPTVTAIYKGMIVDMSAYGALPANQQFVTEWSIDSGSTWQTSGAIVGTSNKIVHSNLTLGIGYRYRYKIRGATDSAYSPSSTVTTPSNQAETNAFGLIVASQISVANLAAINANIGTITAGLLQDPQGKFKIDLNNRLITMIDEQGSPVTRIRLGELNTGLTDWGLEINDNLGRTVFNADGLGAEARIFGQNRQLSQVMTFAIPNSEFDLWNGSTVLHWAVDTTGGATYSKESVVVYSNDFSLKYSNPDNATNGGWHGISTNDAYKGAFCATLRPGLTYQIRTAARSSRIDQGQQYRIKVSSDAGETLQQSKTFDFREANKWQSDTWAITINSGASPNSKVYIEFNRNGDTTATDFYIDSIRLIEVEEAQFYDNTTTGATLTVDWAYGPTQKILVTSVGTTLNFLNGRPGQSYVLEVQQDSTGSRTITTYDSKVYWPADTAPTLTTTANKVDLLGFECVYLPGGTEVAYMGRSIASNYTQNDIRAYTGSFNWNSGMTVGTDIVVSGVPFSPKLIIFWSAGRPEQLLDSGGSRDTYMMFGAAVPGNQFAIGSREADNVASTQCDRSCTSTSSVLEIGNAAITGRLSVQSFNTNGFTMNVDDQSAQVHQIMYLALGGNTFVASITNANIYPTTTGYTSMAHGLSTTPSAIFFVTADGNDTSGEDVVYTNTHWGIGVGTGSSASFALAGSFGDGVGTPLPKSGGYTGSILDWQITPAGAIGNRTELSGQAPFTSSLCRFRVLETTAEVSLYYTIAIGGCKAMVTNERSQTDLVTDITLTPSAQLQPQAILMFTHCSGTTTSNTSDPHMQAGIGAAVKLSTGQIIQQCSIAAQRQFASPANSQGMAGHYYNAVYANMDVTSDLLEGRMRATGMNAGTNGVKFRMDDADPQRYRFGALIIGN